nr:hypothetical protein [Aeromonas veronii]
MGGKLTITATAIQRVAVVGQLGFQLFNPGFQLGHGAGDVGITTQLGTQLGHASDQLFFFSHGMGS